MPFSYSYMIDMSTVQLSEDPNKVTWIQAMPLGAYDHPQHGTIVFDENRVKNFADGVTNNVRGTELDIDYDHKEYGGQAAGWVKAAEARPEGLFLGVSFTPKASQMLKDKEYRYFSPEFIDEWKHPKTGITHKDVLFGGGITNRPFLKDIAPITFKEPLEANSSAGDSNEGGKNVTDEQRKAKAVELGLAEDASTEEILQYIIDNPAVEEEEASEEVSEDKELVSASDKALLDAAKKLSETNPELKTVVDSLIARQADTEKQLSETRATLRLTEVTNAIKSLNDKLDAKGHTMTPVLLKKLSDFVFALPTKQLNDSAIAILSDLVDMTTVKLGENGKTRKVGDETTKSAIVEMGEKATAIMAAKNISLSDAMKELSESDPKLFADYREESTAFNA